MNQIILEVSPYIFSLWYIVLTEVWEELTYLQRTRIAFYILFRSARFPKMVWGTT